MNSIVNEKWDQQITDDDYPEFEILHKITRYRSHQSFNSNHSKSILKGETS